MKMMTRLLARFVYKLELTQNSQRALSTQRTRLRDRSKHPQHSASMSSFPNDSTTTSSDVRGPMLGSQRHSRSDSISTSVENFMPRDVPPIRPKLTKMPSFDEATEQPPGDTAPPSQSLSTNQNPTSLNIRNLRDRVTSGLPSLVLEDDSRSATPLSLPSSPAVPEAPFAESQSTTDLQPDSSVEESSTTLCESLPSAVRVDSQLTTGEGNGEHAIDRMSMDRMSVDRVSLSNKEGAALESVEGSLAHGVTVDDDDLPPGNLQLKNVRRRALVSSTWCCGKYLICLLA